MHILRSHLIPSGICCAATLFSSCVAYQPAALHPEESQAALQKRSLHDPDLLAFVSAETPAIQPATYPATYPATTTPTTAPATWTLEKLSRAALFYHPDLDIARAKILASQAAQITAGESPNPSLSFSPSYATKADGQNPWTLGFSFDIPIETAGKRGLRLGKARALTDAARMELAQTAWQVRSRLRDALAEYLFDTTEDSLWENEVQARERYLSAFDIRRKAGEASLPEVNIARIDLLSARQSLRGIQGETADARTKLAAAIGLPTTGLEDATFEFPDLTNFTPLSADAAENLRTAGLLNRLDIRRTLLEYAAAEKSLQLEIAKQYPDLHLGPGYTFDQGQNKWELGASIELPILNQNGGAIAEARAKRAQTAAEFFALQAQAIAESESALARYQSALAELADAQSQLDAAGQQLDSANRGLNAGEEDRLTVTGFEVQHDVALRLRLDVLRKTQQARAALEDAIQRPLPSESTPTPATQNEVHVP